MACTSLKAVEEINVKEKIFYGKHIADMQRELDLCGDVVSNVPTSVVDTPGDHVDVLTSCTDVGRAEKSSGKQTNIG